MVVATAARDIGLSPIRKLWSPSGTRTETVVSTARSYTDVLRALPGAPGRSALSLAQKLRGAQVRPRRQRFALCT